MSATNTVASFFLFCLVDFFYITTRTTEPASGNASKLVVQRVPPFISILNVGYKTGRDYRVSLLNFFGTVGLFSNFFVSKGSCHDFHHVKPKILSSGHPDRRGLKTSSTQCESSTLLLNEPLQQQNQTSRHNSVTTTTNRNHYHKRVMLLYSFHLNT